MASGHFNCEACCGISLTSPQTSGRFLSGIAIVCVFGVRACVRACVLHRIPHTSSWHQGDLETPC